MKANKICAFALAALTLFGLNACKDKNDDKSLELTPTSATLKVGETQQLVANIAVDEWKTSDEKIATVSNSGLVTAVAEGTAIVSATANGTTKTCVVKVTANGGGSGDQGGSKEVKGSQIWPIIMDATTSDKVQSKIVADFRIDDTNNHLYIWSNGETYTAGEGAGLNFFGNPDGYVSLVVAAPAGWSGCGIHIGATSAAQVEALRKAIIADPDSYYLHLAMKATTTGNHQFYTFGDAVTSFAVGTATIEKGAVIGDFTRDGSWAEFDVPMSQFATALSELKEITADVDILSVLSGPQVGSQLNLDAVYFYKK